MFWIIALVWILIGVGTWGYHGKDMDNLCLPSERGYTLFTFLILCIVLGPFIAAIFIGDWLREEIRKE
jgi:hypothetical protein